MAKLLVIPASKRMLLSELLPNHVTLSELLSVEALSDWPPPLFDRASYLHFWKTQKRNPRAYRWGLYYLIDNKGPRRLVGSGGFISPPANRKVEIGYSILPEFQNKGYATSLVEILICKAFKTGLVDTVYAKTLSPENASSKVLKKSGFSMVDQQEPKYAYFELNKTYANDDYLLKWKTTNRFSP